MAAANDGRRPRGLRRDRIYLRQLRHQAAPGLREDTRFANRPVGPRSGRSRARRQGIDSSMASAPQPPTALALWPYQEARRLAERVGGYEAGRAVVFQSGFGPSGLPHLGTMGEGLRPSYVRHAFKLLSAA